MIRIAITGRPGIGKSTLCKKVISSISKKAGGMISGDIRVGRQRVGFEIVDIATGKKGILAHVNQKEGPIVGKYKVNLRDLNEVGVEAIKNALNCDLIVIDEIAPMELYSKDFLLAVETALQSNKSMLVTFHQRSTHPLIQRIRSTFEVYVLNEHNRDSLAREIAGRLNAD
ncbi:MAG: NTPase [Methanocellales archaeon]